MKIIDINKSIGVKSFNFPDSQPHVNIFGINEGDEVGVVCSIKDSDILLKLLECSNALDNVFAKKKTLSIPYLMGARFDRLMQPGDSVDLKVISDMINYCNFDKVYLYDVHSDAAPLLINNSVNISNKDLVLNYNKENSILICPDAGAVKKVGKYLEWNKNIVDVVYCNKSRDLSNGNISLVVLDPEKCNDRNCVIIDDLCDGGGTFLGISSQISPLSLTLVVTHGIFSKGIHIFKGVFDEVFTSNSYTEYQSNDFLKVIPHNL